MFNLKLLKLLVLTFFLTSQILFSQIVLQGTVTDNGAEYLGNGSEPLSGALVTVTDQADTDRTFSSYTDDQGHYSVEISQTTVDADPFAGPGSFRLLQNYPNPFNPSTVIGYELSSPTHVTLEIFNLLGQKLKTLLVGYQIGSSRVVWNRVDDQGHSVPAGVYIYSMRVAGRSVQKKMLLLNGHKGSVFDAVSQPKMIVQSDVVNVQKQLSDKYTIILTGENIAAYEQQDVTIRASMTLDIIGTRTVTDIDSIVYTTVKIGDQWWMAENLKVTHYRNGDAIPNVTDNGEWGALSIDAWCAYNNCEMMAEIYGNLYNWYAVNDSRNLAPEGWHVPTDEEWKELEMVLGMNQSEVDDTGYRCANSGSKLAGNATLWFNGELKNSTAFGESGFFALPAGYRGGYNNDFYHLRYDDFFWTATEYNIENIWCRRLAYNNSRINRGKFYKRYGISIRLIRDN